jgi:hypothetical protein
LKVSADFRLLVQHDMQVRTIPRRAIALRECGG